MPYDVIWYEIMKYDVMIYEGDPKNEDDLINEDDPEM